MVRTQSTMLPLGTSLPPFDLAVVKGINQTGNSFRGIERISSNILPKKPVLIMVICAHCPFVKHIEQGISKLDQDYGQRVQLIGIASNSFITHPQDGPEKLALQSNQQGWMFPYLIDKDQNLAKALKAACTPDFFLFAPLENGSQTLRYRGQLDGSRPGNNVLVNGEDLRTALDAVLQGKEVFSDQKPSIGCNIKWHPGKEPSWFG